MVRFLLAGAILAVAGGVAAAPLPAAKASAATAPAATVPAALFGALSWREVGPYRGGRVDSVTGVAGRPNVAYFGAVDGGVFKTTDAGTTWQPLFQHEAVGSIGAVEVAPSDPRIVYVGTGETSIRSNVTYGNGVYRSDDGGATWRHLGLDDTRHIGRLLVDPSNPDRVVVAALGHVFGPNAERGIFQTTDGGRTWKHVLAVDAHTGAVDLARDPARPSSLYATTWNAERMPWFQYAPVDGPGSAIYHSADNGATWQKLAGHGLPDDMGRIGVAVTDASGAPRLYAIVSAGSHAGGANQAGAGSGLYRSDDGGATWRLVNADTRLSGRGWYFGRVYADAKDPDLVYIPNTSLYRSRDGGAHFTAIKGSPDGDDMRAMWLDPDNPAHLVLAADQGASISLDDGAHWSGWFNQPTAQIYHFSVDDQTPYHLYGTQQDSGALSIASRGPTGIISNDDWDPVGGGESGYLFPRKGDPSVIYGAGSGGSITRYDRRTHVTTDISPEALRSFGAPPTPAGSYYPWNTAFAPSPFDADTLYMAGQKVMRSTDGGAHWEAMSPILTAKDAKARCSGTPTRKTGAACGYSVVYALAPSPAARGVVWAGTDDARIWLTRDDGAHWTNVTPPDLAPWSRVDAIDADPHDPASAYVAVDRHQVDDHTPYVYITHDAGAHWRLATRGIPAGHYVRAVRADPVRKGLLYAGTEQGVVVSFDDGASWQSLQRNLPTSAVHELRVHDDDLIVGTHGRGFWILDDIEPLREAAAGIAQDAVHLYAPRPALRLRLGTYPGEARPPEVPHAANPPTGAVIDYWLARAPGTPVTLAIYDAGGALVRRYSSADQPAAMPAPAYPDYYTSPAAVLPAGAGAHRFVWDLRVTPPAGAPRWGGPAVLGRTPRAPLGPLVLPGTYRVVLTVDGRDYAQPLVVRADPNAGTTPGALAANVGFARGLVAEIDANAAAAARAPAGPELAAVNRRLMSLLEGVISNDEAPTAAAVHAADELRAEGARARGGRP